MINILVINTPEQTLNDWLNELREVAQEYGLNADVLKKYRNPKWYT